MFITSGNRRINLSQIREYKPFERDLHDKKYYFIGIIYNNGDKEEFSFIEKEGRDKMMAELDKSSRALSLNEKI